MHRAAIERQLFDPAMRCKQDRPARRFVHAARFHPDEAVFDEIEPADAVAAAVIVQGGEQGCWAHRRAIDRDGIAAFEGDNDIFGCIGRVFGIVGARIDVIGHFVPRILEHLALRRGVEQIGVGRKRRLAALVLGDRNIVRLGEFDQARAAGQIPFAPRRDHLDIGIECIIA